MNHQKAATVEVVCLKDRVEELEAKVAELTTVIEKIEAECLRGLSLETHARGALNTIFMLARRKP